MAKKPKKFPVCTTETLLKAEYNDIWLVVKSVGRSAVGRLVDRFVGSVGA